MMRYKPYISRAARDSIAAQSVKARLGQIVTRKQLKDFFGGLLAGLVLFSPILLDIAGCIKN
jgi:hypothetical protein